MLKQLVIGSLILAGCLLPAQLVLAQSPEVPAMNLTLSPVSLALETDPGVPVTAQIQVRNNASQTEKLTVQIGSFTADETGAKPILLDTPENPESLKWLQPSTPELEIQPGEWQTLALTFSPPDQAALNYFYALYLSRTVTGVDGNTVIKGSPAVLILTTVTSPFAQRTLELESFSVGKAWSEFLPQEFLIKVKNTGNVLAVPAGNIFIDGQGQKDLAVLSINPDSHAVLPQSSRTFSVIWDDGFPKSQSSHTPTIQTGFSALGLDWNFSQADRFRLGAYTAHLLLVYDNGERDVPIEAFAPFWLIPWKLLVVGLGMIVFAVVGVVATGKKIWQMFRQLSG